MVLVYIGLCYLPGPFIFPKGHLRLNKPSLGVRDAGNARDAGAEDSCERLAKDVEPSPMGARLLLEEGRAGLADVFQTRPGPFGRYTLFRMCRVDSIATHTHTLYVYMHDV